MFDKILPFLDYGFQGVALVALALGYKTTVETETITENRLKLIKFYFLLIVIILLMVLVLSVAKDKLATKQLNQSENQKHDINSIYVNELKSLKSEIGKLRVDKFDLNRRLNLPVNSISNWINGVILSNDGKPVVNVVVSIRGGSEVLSQPNGEFVIDANIGDHVQISYRGQLLRTFILTESDLGQYRSVILDNLEQ